MPKALMYVAPFSKQGLRKENDALVDADGGRYPFMPGTPGINPVPVFINTAQVSGGDAVSQAMYRKIDAEVFYENFLDWLYRTFSVDANAFRNSLVDRLQIGPGSRALVTGCGLGDDVACVVARVGIQGQVHAQDISDVMIAATARRLYTEAGIDSANIYLDVSNAAQLPYPDDYFDAALHFGGINLFSDMKGAIDEMARVVKPGGKVVFGDEGVAPWLRDSDHGKAAICNNPLWESEPPLALLPETASHVNLSWVLGNCFYLIDFVVSNAMPYMDMDVLHQGIRGGSMRKRFYGQLEGVDPELKARLTGMASTMGMSVSACLERIITRALGDDGIQPHE